MSRSPTASKSLGLASSAARKKLSTQTSSRVLRQPPFCAGQSHARSPLKSPCVSFSLLRVHCFLRQQKERCQTLVLSQHLLADVWWAFWAGGSRCVAFDKGQLAILRPRLAHQRWHIGLDRRQRYTAQIMERKLPPLQVFECWPRILSVVVEHDCACVLVRSRGSLLDSVGRRRNPPVRREAWQCQNTRRAPTTPTQAPRRPVDQLLRQLCTWFLRPRPLQTPLEFCTCTSFRIAAMGHGTAARRTSATKTCERFASCSGSRKTQRLRPVDSLCP